MDRLKKVLIFILAIAPPLVLNYTLGNRYLIIIFGAIVLSLLLVYKTTYIQVVLTILVITGIYFLIIIIPYSFYSVWFNQLGENIPNSRITDLIISIWIISYIYNTLNTVKNKKSFIYSLVITFIFYSILFNKPKYLISIPLILGIYIILTNWKYGKKIQLGISLILILSLSFYIAQKSSVNGSKSVDNISHSIRKFIVEKYPSLDILTTIPGSEGISESKGRSPVLTNSKLFKIWGNPGNTYYLRMKIEDQNNNVRFIDKKILEKPLLDGIKLEVLSDFLPIIPSINGSEYNKTLVPFSPLNRSDIFYIPTTNSSYNTVSNSYSQAGYINRDLLELGNSLKGRSDYETLNNIKRYLHDNYTYSRDTENRADMIEYFLFTQKEGFCVHYTRSFIKLARINGITVREVSGYQVKIKRPENDQFKGYNYITGKNSHMWPEVYIDSKWITFEVTPGYDPIRNPATATSEILPNKILEEIKSTEEESQIVWILYLIPVLFIGAILLFKYIYRNPIKELIRKSAKKGVRHPSKIGWVEWNLQLFKTLEHSNYFLDYAYNKKALSKEDKAYIRRLLKLI